MQKIIYFGALAFGISANQFEPVAAPCGCAQQCQQVPKAAVPVQQKCCLVAMPCGQQEATCVDKPDKIVGAVAHNKVCSHVTFDWTAPKSCCDTKGIEQYQIKVKTSAASETWRELPAIPGSYTSYRVSNAQLQASPFNLAKDSIIEWQIRSWCANGWSEWSKGNEKCYDPVVVAVAGEPVFTANPPNGLQCVNSYWNGFRCINPNKIFEAKVPSNNFVEEDQCHAVVEECEVIAPKARKIRRVQSPVAQVQAAPQSNWNVCCQMPQQISSMCGCPQQQQAPVAQVPIVPQVELPGPVQEVECVSNCPAADTGCVSRCAATGL